MSQMANVVIVMCRCSHRREGFGIRMEEKAVSVWSADWAFPVQDHLAKKEGYDRNEIQGQISIDEAYPGCPYCKNSSIALCGSCDKVFCYDNRSDPVTCPWCGRSAQVAGVITGLRAGGDL